MIFLLGREYAIPISTITVAHTWINKPWRSRNNFMINDGWLAEVIIINPGIPPRGVNDNGNSR